jgi:hypothetical protein
MHRFQSKYALHRADKIQIADSDRFRHEPQLQFGSLFNLEL